MGSCSSLEGEGEDEQRRQSETRPVQFRHDKRGNVHNGPIKREHVYREQNRHAQKGNGDSEQNRHAQSAQKTGNTASKLSAESPGGNIKALHGDVTMECPSDEKIVRIFTSSTFTDTKQERNYLMQHAYPKIKSHCQELGYEFQVVDMRWGVRDEASDDHMTTELCLKELKLCQEVSTGPNFVTLLSHKYGYTPFPRVIPASEFETLMTAIEDPKTLVLFQKLAQKIYDGILGCYRLACLTSPVNDRQILEENHSHIWYLRDDNAVPPEYVLCPISKSLPGFISKEKEVKEAAKQTWNKENEMMQTALEQSALKLFDKQHARKFIMSVTESEIEEGLLHFKDPSSQCLWLKRNIVDIEKQEKNYALSRFMECLGPEEKYTRAQTLLKELKDKRIKEVLNENKILQYKVHWAQNGGINPDESTEHKNYLRKLSDDFTVNMIAMIDSAVNAKPPRDDLLINECMEHIRFCQLKCRNFHGRKETLEKIKTYVTPEDVKKSPLVVHGNSGLGKTSIMAMVAKLIGEWRTPKPLILLRFLGTTQDSSSLMSLLYSMTSQIQRCLEEKVTSPTEDIKEQTTRFWDAVKRYQKTKPLVIILDSLDQLDDSDDARSLKWMAVKGTKGTIIVSTLEEPKYGCFPALQQLVKEPSNFVGIPPMSHETSTHILSSWFKMNKRQVTSTQTDRLLDAFDKCKTPLFLKLSFDEALRWTSYIHEDEMILCDTVRSSIDHLFTRLERVHGHMLLSRSLAYMTLAKNGASEVELEDLLSCDDDVLNSVYMYHVPPSRRLPPLLLVRIRTDLSQYLVERGADGVKVIYWYHRQFVEAAEARYCSDPKTNKFIHRNLADFFGGVWADGNKKPGFNSKGEAITEDRYISAQPLLFGEGKYNLRRLNNTPYHCIKGGNKKMLLKQCLANIDFLWTKLKAVNFLSVIDDFRIANKTFPDDTLVSAILSVLQLSQKGLQTDPGQIIPQMVQRLPETPATSEFLRQCRRYNQTYIEPNIPLVDLTGGQVVQTLPTGSDGAGVKMMDMSTDGKLVMIVYLVEVELWSIDEAKLQRSIRIEDRLDDAYFCLNNTAVVLMTYEDNIEVYDVKTGNLKLKTKTLKAGSWCVVGANKERVVVMRGKTCNIYNLDNNGEEMTVLELAENIDPWEPFCTGSTNFVAIIERWFVEVENNSTRRYTDPPMNSTDDYRRYFSISVLDVRTRQFMEPFNLVYRFEESTVEEWRIAPDETSLVFIVWNTREVVFVDFTGRKLRNIPGQDVLFFNTFAFSLDGANLLLCSDKQVHVVDMKSLKNVSTIDHTMKVKDARAGDANNVITVSEDGYLRIWDMAREKLDVVDKPTPLKQTEIRSVHLLRNPRYLLIQAKIDGYLSIVVYDIFQEKVVKTASIKAVAQYVVQDPLTLYKVHLWIEKKLYTIDLNTLTMEMRTKGYIGKVSPSPYYTANNEILCLTKHRQNLKFYDKNTGKMTRILKVDHRFYDKNTGEMTKILKVDHRHEILELIMNKSGTIACALNRCGVVLVFDLVNYKQLFSIQTKEADIDDFRVTEMLINRCGTILLYTKSTRLEEFKDDEEDADVNVVVVWDILKGKLLHRLEGHAAEPTVYVEENSPFFLTKTKPRDENCIRLWSKETCQCLASYTLERNTKHICISPDGRFFTSILVEGNQSFLVQWRIHNSPFNCTVRESNYPIEFPSEVGEKEFEFDALTYIEDDVDDSDEYDDSATSRIDITRNA